MFVDASKIVVITQRTALEELEVRFSGQYAQAKFYLARSRVSFDPYQFAHEAYMSALEQLKAGSPVECHHQFVERSFVPNFVFGEHDVVVVLG
jgi:hypothetical protein